MDSCSLFFYVTEANQIKHKKRFHFELKSVTSLFRTHLPFLKPFQYQFIDFWPPILPFMCSDTNCVLSAHIDRNLAAMTSNDTFPFLLEVHKISYSQMCIWSLAHMHSHTEKEIHLPQERIHWFLLLARFLWLRAVGE